jgi:hypothetical protein
MTGLPCVLRDGRFFACLEWVALPDLDERLWQDLLAEACAHATAPG